VTIVSKGYKDLLVHKENRVPQAVLGLAVVVVSMALMDFPEYLGRKEFKVLK